MSVSLILSFLTVAIFLVWMFVTRDDKNRLFVQFILVAYPFLNAYILPGKFAMNGFNLLVYIFTFCFYKRRRDVHLKNKGIAFTTLFVILLVNILVGLFLAESLGDDTIRDILDFFPIFIFAKIVTDECLDDPSFFYKIIACLRITLMVAFFFLCCQFVLGVSFTLSTVQNPNMSGDVARYPGFFSDPQVFSQYLAAMSFLCLIKNPEDERLPLLNYALLIFSVIAIMYTGGRGGLGGWAAGFFFVAMFGNSKYRTSAIITAILLFGIVYAFGDKFAVFQRGDNLNDSYEDRLSIWKDAFQIYLNNPFFGIGLGNYSNYVSVHNPDQFWMVGQEVVYYDHPESGYLKLLTELGSFGFLSFLGLIFVPIINGILLYLRKKNIAIILLIAAVLSWLVAFYTVYSLGDVRMKLLIVTLICLIITSSQRVQFEENAEETI